MRGARRCRYHGRCHKCFGPSRETPLAQVWLVVMGMYSVAPSFAWLLKSNPFKGPLHRRSRCAVRGVHRVFMNYDHHAFAANDRSSWVCRFCIRGAHRTPQQFEALPALPNSAMFSLVLSNAGSVAILSPETPPFWRTIKPSPDLKMGDIIDCSFYGKDACLSGHKMFF